MGIPAIRESIVLHRHRQGPRLGYFEGAKLLAFVQSSGGGVQWFAVVCGGLPAFHCFHYLSSQIMVVICGGLRLAVICGGLRSFGVVCDGLRWFVLYSHTVKKDNSPNHSCVSLKMGCLEYT